MVAKRKKTAWRKDIDLSKVEEGISKKKEKERLLGSVVSDESLFVIDKTGDDKVRRQVKKMRIDEILKPNSKVVVPPSKVRPKKSEIIEKKRVVLLPKKILKKYHQKPTATNNKKQGSSTGSRNSSSPSLDLWGSAPATKVEDTLEYVPKVEPPKRTSDKAPVKSAEIVKVAHQGSSYRPDIDSYKVTKIGFNVWALFNIFKIEFIGTG